jgi:hypothetical protein
VKQRHNGCPTEADIIIGLLSRHGNKEILQEAGAATGETHGYFG